MTDSRLTPQHPGRKLMVSIGFIVISILYVLWQHPDDTTTVTADNKSTTSPAGAYQTANQRLLRTLATLTSTSTGSGNTSSPTTAPSTPAPTPTAVSPTPRGLYADGSYIGSPADAYYGTVQVEAVIHGGKITDVQFLQHPGGRETSIYINSQAMPLLTQEAIQVQSAQVNGVSGATETSRAFIESLSSALTKAKNA